MSGWGIVKELVMKDNKGDTEDNEIGNGEKPGRKWQYCLIVNSRKR